MLSFELDKDFINKYKDIPEPFGFSGLGAVTFYRTYSRLKDDGSYETWCEVCTRVIEGMYSIQKDHCFLNKRPWSDKKAQDSANEAFDRLFNLKWSPSGRGLWLLGTEFINERKVAEALMNCAFISTNTIARDKGMIFSWFMEMLMLGVGVGSDVRGEDEVFVGKPSQARKRVIKVEDTRESWAESVEILIDTYLYTDRNTYLNGNADAVEFDYSQIRPAGAPIKGFGGISSGAEPLIKLHERIRGYLDKNAGFYLTTRTLVDIFNAIGACVVAGNVRRSAEIMFGESDNEQFQDLKNYAKNPERSEIGWVSNNSIFASVGDNYSNVSRRMSVNGEPGIFWLENAQQFGRMDELKPDNAIGTNPCLTGETLVAVADGRHHVRIDQIEDGTPVWCNDDDGNLVIRPMRHPRITGKNLPVYKVTLDDGTVVRATANHKFRSRNGEMIEVSDLNPGDSLVVLSKYIPDFEGQSRIDQYYTLSWLSNAPYTEHVEIAKYANKVNDLAGQHVHHIDGNKLNNTPNNLQVLNSVTHLSDHAVGLNNGNSSGITNDELIQYGMQLCLKLNRRFSTKEWLAYGKENNIPGRFSDYRIDTIGTVSEFASLCADKSGVINANLDTRQLETWNKLIDDGYSPVVIDNDIFVQKICEGCGKPIEINFLQREVGYCSNLCYNKNGRDYSKNQAGLNEYSMKLAEENKDKQVKMLLDMKFENNGQWPQKKDWEQRCRQEQIPTRMGHNEYVFKGFNDMKEYASVYNHRVVSVEFDGYEDVWNGTVDDYHNFFVGGQFGETTRNRAKWSYINNPNCGEQPLANKEACNLIEVYMHNHDDLYDYLRTLKFAYLYGKTITLTYDWITDYDTRKIMQQNRRIGLSNTGVAQFLTRHDLQTLITFWDRGYESVQHYDTSYSGWLDINKSIRTTTFKPSGTVSLVAGATPGIHHPQSEYYIRRIRIQNDTDLLKILQNCGFYTEPDAYSDNTTCVEFPIHVADNIRTEKEMSIWEQLELTALAQKHWADNAVSVTIKFDPNKTTSGEIERALNFYQFRLKGVSFLPEPEEGAYVQMPYQEITKEQYETKVKYIDFEPLGFLGRAMDSRNQEYELFCNTDACLLPQKVI